jgi:hypothetical protein
MPSIDRCARVGARAADFALNVARELRISSLRGSPVVLAPLEARLFEAERDEEVEKIRTATQ